MTLQDIAGIWELFEELKERSKPKDKDKDKKKDDEQVTAKDVLATLMVMQIFMLIGAGSAWIFLH